MKLHFYIVCILFQSALSGCSGYKKAFTEKLSDGTSIILMHPIKNLSQNRFLTAAHGKYNVMHNEYRINKFSCDSIIKLIFNKGNITVLYLTKEISSSYEISEADRLMFVKAEPYIDSNNKCYTEFIKEAKGYRLNYSGKFDRKLMFY